MKKYPYPTADDAELALEQLKVIEAMKEVMDTLKGQVSDFYSKAMRSGLIASVNPKNKETPYNFRTEQENSEVVYFKTELELLTYMVGYIKLIKIEGPNDQ